MNTILNETKSAEALQALREKLSKIAPLAAQAINEHQPLGVNPKVGIAATVIGTAAAVGVQKAIIAKRTGSFFLSSVVKSFKDARKAFREMDKLYETMVRNLKTETVISTPLTKEQVDEIKTAVEAGKLDIQNA